MAWQDALAGHRPPGYLRGWTWRVAAPPWLVGWPDEVYLDGYVVADFTALGALNADAPSGPLAAAHHSAAGRAAYGAGALFACRTGTAGPDLAGPNPDGRVSGRPNTGSDPSGKQAAMVQLSWHEKPAGTPYGEVIDGLSGEGRSVWLRQMVLGAGPELLVVSRDGDAPVWGVWQASAERLVG